MTYRVRFDICYEELPDVETTLAFLDELPTMVFPHGGRAAAYWFAPAESISDALRLDLDFDTGRGAVRWLPDSVHGIELDPAGAIVVLETSNGPIATIPAELARVSVDTARRAAIEYVTTGQRPTCLTWVADPAAAPSARRP